MVPAGQWAKSVIPRGAWTYDDLAAQWGLGRRRVIELVKKSGVEYGVRAYCVIGPGGRMVSRRLAIFTPETVEYLTRWRAGYRLPAGQAMRNAGNAGNAGNTMRPRKDNARVAPARGARARKTSG